MTTILATTSSFAVGNGRLHVKLTEKGFRLVQNPFKRKLTETELASLLKNYKPAGLIAGVEPITSDILKNASEYLRVVSRVGVGWDNINHKAAAEFGIKIFRTPDAVTRAVVELTIGLFIDLSRHISAHDRSLRQGKWQKKMGLLIQDKTLSVIGCGRIGKGVCLAMRVLGCKVQALDPCHDVAWHEKNNILLIDTIEEVFRTSDLISIHASMPKESHCLITRKHFEIANPNLLLINLARGGIVDEESLSDALRNGRIAGAALDVFEQEPYNGPLCKLDNVILTPHIGSYAKESRQLMEEEAVENLLQGLEHK